MRRVDTHDDFETRFWLDTVTVGGWATLLMCLAGLSYAGLCAAPSHRMGVAAMAALTAVGGGVALWAIPWRRVIASRWRETAFFAWTLMTISAVALTAALDGGAGSPLALMLFLPAVFASMAYPLRLVVVVAVLAEAVFLLLVTFDPPAAGYVVGVCSALAGTSGMAVWQAANHDAWRHELARTSTIDPLTQLLNRRGFAAAADTAFAALARHGRPVTLLVLDLNLFKAYNDTNGHQAGDELLAWVADALRDAVRPCDAVARLGGDEFAVLLLDTGSDSAVTLIDRIEHGIDGRAALCLGRASATDPGTSYDALYREADSDLYRRKLVQRRAPVPGVRRTSAAALSATTRP